MKKYIPVILLIIVIVVVILIATTLVVNNYKKNKPIIPDNSLELVSENEMAKIKEKYEDKRKQQDFLDLCSEIELAVTNRFLDGSVTNEDELNEAIKETNEILKSNNWDKLGLKYNSYWMGTWSVDSSGKVKFSFKYKEIVPSWVNSEEVSKYIK